MCGMDFVLSRSSLVTFRIVPYRRAGSTRINDLGALQQHRFITTLPDASLPASKGLIRIFPGYLEGIERLDSHSN